LTLGARKLIPGDVLKDFKRPKIGRPKKAVEQTKTGKTAKKQALR
jgi:hypothetical protein